MIRLVLDLVRKLDSSNPGIIEPQMSHHIKACGPASFYVEFLKAANLFYLEEFL